MGSFVKDHVPPTLTGFGLDLNKGYLILEFDEVGSGMIHPVFSISQYTLLIHPVNPPILPPTFLYPPILSPPFTPSLQVVQGQNIRPTLPTHSIHPLHPLNATSRPPILSPPPSNPTFLSPPPLPFTPSLQVVQGQNIRPTGLQLRSKPVLTGANAYAVNLTQESYGLDYIDSTVRYLTSCHPPCLPLSLFLVISPAFSITLSYPRELRP